MHPYTTEDFLVFTALTALRILTEEESDEHRGRIKKRCKSEKASAPREKVSLSRQGDIHASGTTRLPGTLSCTPWYPLE